MPGDAVRPTGVRLGGELCLHGRRDPQPAGGRVPSGPRIQAQHQATDTSAAARQSAEGVQGKAEAQAGRLPSAGREEVRRQSQGQKGRPEGQMMLTGLARLAGQRGRWLVAAAVAMGAPGLFATPALAAPEWGITMKHENPFGAKGGVDPYT